METPVPSDRHPASPAALRLLRQLLAGNEPADVARWIAAAIEAGVVLSPRDAKSLAGYAAGTEMARLVSRLVDRPDREDAVAPALWQGDAHEKSTIFGRLALGDDDRGEARRIMRAHFAAEAASTRCMMMSFLGSRAEPADVPLLEAGLDDPDPGVRYEAVEGLCRIEGHPMAAEVWRHVAPLFETGAAGVRFRPPAEPDPAWARFGRNAYINFGPVGWLLRLLRPQTIAAGLGLSLPALVSLASGDRTLGFLWPDWLRSLAGEDRETVAALIGIVGWYNALDLMGRHSSRDEGPVLRAFIAHYRPVLFGAAPGGGGHLHSDNHYPAMDGFEVTALPSYFLRWRPETVDDGMALVEEMIPWLAANDAPLCQWPSVLPSLPAEGFATKLVPLYERVAREIPAAADATRWTVNAWRREMDLRDRLAAVFAA